MTRVLVVDDDADIRSFVSGLLVDEATLSKVRVTGLQALQRARVALPAVILLDLMMPAGEFSD